MNKMVYNKFDLELMNLQEMFEKSKRFATDTAACTEECELIEDCRKYGLYCEGRESKCKHAIRGV